MFDEDEGESGARDWRGEVGGGGGAYSSTAMVCRVASDRIQAGVAWASEAKE
jgi:hypothetical protein